MLTDRESYAAAFYRLTATSATHPGLLEHGASLEVLYELLQSAAWDAQAFLIDAGLADRWVSLSAAFTFAEAADGSLYASLPSDFLRLSGDKYRSGLRVPGDSPWGQEVDFLDRHYAGSGCYWLENERLYLTAGSAPPAGLKMDYHHRLATLADSVTADFPTEHRALIPAFAADMAKDETWFPGDLEAKAAIATNLRNRKREALRRARRTRSPRTLRSSRAPRSGHWL